MAQQATEYQVKAVFIYNLVNFIEWPPSTFNDTNNHFVIGVAGNVFGNYLQEAVSGESYRGRRIVIKLIEKPDDAAACQVIFLSRHSQITNEIIKRTRTMPVLTIGDSENFLHQGGIVRFFLENNKVRIEINQSKATDLQLQVSSKLLRVAIIYDRK